MQAALHQQLGGALAHEFDGQLGGRLTMRRIDDLVPGDVERELFGDGLDLGFGTDKDRHDQSRACRIEGPAERTLVAWVSHRRGKRLKSSGRRQKPIVLIVLAQLRDYCLLGHGTDPLARTMRGYPSPLQVQRCLSRHAAGKADDLGVEFVAERSQLLVEEVIGILGEPLECRRPLGVGDIDAAAAIRAEACMGTSRPGSGVHRAWRRHSRQG